MDKRSFFDKHSTSWDSTRHPGEKEKLPRVVSLAVVEPGQRVLDVGAGTGVLVPHLLLAMNNSGEIVELDSSAEMLEVGRGKGFPDSVSFLETDIHHVPLPDESFDRVICNAAFPHFDDKPTSLLEMIRLLRPGGILVISHPIGREAVNDLHRDVDESVAMDRVPPAEVMAALLRDAGLIDVSVLDEPEFYLARATKPL